MKVEVGNIALVVGALLVIHAILEHLTVQFVTENLPAQVTPPRRLSELRKRAAKVQKPERFACEVCVRGVECRQMRLDMPTVEYEHLEHACHQWPAQAVPLAKQMQ